MNQVPRRSLALVTVALALTGCTIRPVTGTAVQPDPGVAATSTAPAAATAPSAPEQPAGAPTPSSAAPAPEDREAATYAVYSAVIQAHYVDTQQSALIVIRDQTAPGAYPIALEEYIEATREGMPGLTAEIGADFIAQNQGSQALKPLFMIDTDYDFISQEEIEATFAQPDGWDSFYARYPNAQGHMRLSGVGFNPQMDTALVYVDNMRAPLAGEGFLLLLKQVNGKWSVEGQTMVWIS